MNLQQPEKRDYNIWIGVFVFLAILNLVIALNIKFIARNGYFRLRSFEKQECSALC